MPPATLPASIPTARPVPPNHPLIDDHVCPEQIGPASRFQLEDDIRHRFIATVLAPVLSVCIFLLATLLTSCASVNSTRTPESTTCATQHDLKLLQTEWDREGGPPSDPRAFLASALESSVAVESIQRFVTQKLQSNNEYHRHAAGRIVLYMPLVQNRILNEELAQALLDNCVSVTNVRPLEIAHRDVLEESVESRYETGHSAPDDHFVPLVSVRFGVWLKCTNDEFLVYKPFTYAFMPLYDNGVDEYAHMENRWKFSIQAVHVNNIECELKPVDREYLTPTLSYMIYDWRKAYPENIDKWIGKFYMMNITIQVNMMTPEGHVVSSITRRTMGVYIDAEL